MASAVRIDGQQQQQQQQQHHHHHHHHSRAVGGATVFLDTPRVVAAPCSRSRHNDDEGRMVALSSPATTTSSSSSSSSSAATSTTEAHGCAVTSPPYWPSSHAYRPRDFSVSTESVVPAAAITLRDNDTGEHSDRNAACWARSVEVVDCTIVNGSATNIGAFVVWNVRVETLSGSHMNIRKRYSEFDELRRQLVQSFPAFEVAVPVLPPKSVISRFRPQFLDKRRAGLQYFLNCIMLNPEFSGSPVLREFLFA